MPCDHHFRKSNVNLSRDLAEIMRIYGEFNRVTDKDEEFLEVMNQRLVALDLAEEVDEARAASIVGGTKRQTSSTKQEEFGPGAAQDVI